MALTANLVWYIRVAGNNLNGGGFDASVSGAGVNRADAASPHVSFNGVTVDASNGGAGATITITGHTVHADDIGNTLRIASGTNFTAGYYTITAVNTGANTWTVDRNCTTGAGTGMVGRMGGAFATVAPLSNGGSAGAPSVTSGLAAGHSIYIDSADNLDDPTTNDYAYTDYYTYVSGTSAAGPVRWFGRGLSGGSGRPLIQVGGLWHYNTTYHYFSNLKIKLNGASFPTIGVIGGSDDIVVLDSYFDINGQDCICVAPRVLRRCRFKNGGSTTAGTYPTIQTRNFVFYIEDNYIQGSRGTGVECANYGGVIARNVINDCNRGIDGINGSVSSGVAIEDNSIYGCNSDGIRLTDALSCLAAVIRRNILVSNGGYGINYNVGTTALNDKRASECNQNAFYNNTSGALANKTAGANDITLTGDPFTNSGSADFTLNNTAGAGAAVRGIVQTMTAGPGSSYRDLGALQHQDAGGGGGLLRHPGMSGGLKG